MEEQIGELWHRFITRVADNEHRHSQVCLAELKRPLAIYFRALGGDGGLQIEAADATAYRRRRSWLQRLAGSEKKVELAWRDRRSLRLPPSLAWFEDTELNTDLYYWLAALATCANGKREHWFRSNQQHCLRVQHNFPGLKPLYQRLLQAHLQQRPDPNDLPGDEAAAESAIRTALREPGSIDELPHAARRPYPIPLWLHPDPPFVHNDSLQDSPEPGPPADNDKEQKRELDDLARRQAERVKEPQSGRGLVTVRMENIFTWGEFAHVDRDTEDEEDLDRAEAVARDLDCLAVTRSTKRAAASLKFDLDLPAEAEDDRVLGDGLLLPEWDWRNQQLVEEHCRIVTLQADRAQPCELPEHLRRTAHRLRQQFQALAPARIWQRGQADGEEVDIDAYLRYQTDRQVGLLASADRLYRQMCSGSRDLSCLLLADLSLSTDSWINDHHRVIDVIRDSLFLFAESLAATGDPHAIFGFSSRKRDPIRLHQIKDFAENHNSRVRGRIQSIKPGYYTRMGAALRYGSRLLEPRPEGRRLLLVLTDGKPNDLDQYEGRYGIEDTRHAVVEARRAGLEPFCVTIDKKASDYLPYLFGSSGYVMIRKPSELPRQLPLLYARLTA